MENNLRCSFSNVIWECELSFSKQQIQLQFYMVLILTAKYTKFWGPFTYFVMNF